MCISPPEIPLSYSILLPRKRLRSKHTGGYKDSAYVGGGDFDHTLREQDEEYEADSFPRNPLASEWAWPPVHTMDCMCIDNE